MEQVSYYASVAGFVLVIALWFVFAGVFFLRKKTEATTDSTKAPRSWAGLILQSLGFAAVWSMRRTPVFSSFIDSQYAANLIFQIFAVVLAAISVWLAMSAIRELGKQWSLQARLVEGHKLITTGVYQTVRHPIYTAMLGMLVATGIAYSNWLATLVGVIIFFIGTKIRTVFEERLLGDAFGEEFTEWKAKVPGSIPFIKF